MRFILPILMLLCLIGCDSDPVSSIDPEFFIGRWIGISSATYPGPDDATLTSEDSIRFVFADSTFQYFWIGEGGNENNAYGSGDYVLGDSTITFSNVLLRGYDEPFDLQGRFEFGLIDSTLSLVQNPTQFFQTYHLVVLEKEPEILD